MSNATVEDLSDVWDLKWKQVGNPSPSLAYFYASTLNASVEVFPNGSAMASVLSPPIQAKGVDAVDALRRLKDIAMARCAAIMRSDGALSDASRARAALGDLGEILARSEDEVVKDYIRGHLGRESLKVAVCWGNDCTICDGNRAIRVLEEGSATFVHCPLCYEGGDDVRVTFNGERMVARVIGVGCAEITFRVTPRHPFWCPELIPDGYVYPEEVIG